jgi:hypothetical protein
MISDPERRAFRLIAGSSDGCTVALLIANGAAIETMVELINAGLATTHTERTRVGDQQIEITGLQITDGGLKAIG